MSLIAEAHISLHFYSERHCLRYVDGVMVRLRSVDDGRINALVVLQAWQEGCTMSYLEPFVAALKCAKSLWWHRFQTTINLCARRRVRPWHTYPEDSGLLCPSG
jgi:hypothetical protein